MCAACGSAPSTASPIACCGPTIWMRACRRTSRSSTPTTSTAWSAGCSRRSTSTRSIGPRAPWWATSTARRTRACAPATSTSTATPSPAPISRSTRPIRRPAIAPGWWILPSSCCAPTSCGLTSRTSSSTTATASRTSWWTSFRIPTASSTPGCGCWRATPARWWSSATMTSPSTAGAVPRSRTSSASWPIIRGPRPSASSRTTAPPPISSKPPTALSPTTPSALARSCGPRGPRASRFRCTPPSTRWTRRASWSAASRTGKRKAGCSPTAPSSIAPTPSRGCWKRRWCRTPCPTASTAACASSSARKSKTPWPTCGLSTTVGTTPASSGSSTPRPAASAIAPSRSCAATPAIRGSTCGNRPRRCSMTRCWPVAPATRCAVSSSSSTRWKSRSPCCPCTSRPISPSSTPASRRCIWRKRARNPRRG